MVRTVRSLADRTFQLRSGVDQAHTDLTSFSTNFMKAVMDLKKERQRKFDKVSGDSSRFMQQIIDQVSRGELG